MAFRYTKHFLKKIEDLFSELDYTVRYEKGNFQSGYCLVENRNIAVINKFYDTEGRINVLLEILNQVPIATDQLDEKWQKFYQEVRQAQGSKENEEGSSNS